jgi:hypothetical protein
VVHNSGGRIRDVGARPRRDETLEEGGELRRLPGREVRERRGHRLTPTPVRLLQDRATGGTQLHHTPSSVVRVDRSGDLAPLRRLGHESARSRLIDPDRLRERADTHAAGRRLTSERVQHPEPGRLSDRLLTRMPAATAGSPRATDAGPEARTTPTSALVPVTAVSVVVMVSSVVIVMTMPGATTPAAAAETTACLVAPDLTEGVLDQRHGVACCGFAGLRLTIVGHTCHYTFTCNKACK